MDNPDETFPNVKQLKDFFTEKIRAEGYEDAKATTVVKTVHSVPSDSVSSEEEIPDIQRINLLFDLVQDFLCSKEFELLVLQFCESFPQYSDELKRRQGDLNRKDLCIIIAGETSAGKSTLINRLVGTRLFKPRVTESTSTICRIYNSNDPIKKISYKVLNKDDETVEERSIDAVFEGEIMECLQKYVDKNGDHVPKDIDHVDISLYVLFLKGNTMIVDTPGIGGSLELSDKMMKYLPNAASFIFVSNVTNAGGVQNDRLVKIIQEVLRLHEEKDIPCFDPTDALFVSNKWDAVDPSERKDAWSRIQHELKKHWPVSDTANIFRTALKSQGKSEVEFEHEYERLVRRLSEVLEKNQHTRRVQHEKFLRNMLKTIEVTVKGCLHAASMSRDACRKKMESLETQLTKLRWSVEKTKDQLSHLISDTLLQLSQALYEELNSEEGKEKILNPPGKKGIASVHFLKITDKVKERLYTYTIEWKRGELVIEKLTFVLERIKEFFAGMQKEIQRIENNVKGSQKTSIQETAVSFELDSPILVGVLESAPKWIAILSAAKRLCAVAEFMLSPIAVMKIKKWITEEKKLIIIDATYEDLVKQYDIQKINSELESTYGSHYRNLVKRLFDEIFEKQLSNLTGTILRLKAECEYFENWNTELKHLLSKLNEIQKRMG